jgi:hypothetical protein
VVISVLRTRLHGLDACHDGIGGTGLRQRGSRTIAGHASGTSQESEDTLRFSVLSDVRPMIEMMPLEQAAQAYNKMLSGNARFRMVLTTGVCPGHAESSRRTTGTAHGLRATAP